MTELDIVVTTFRLWVPLAGLLALWHFGWRRYRLDLFRQRLFDARQELFNLAADGQIAFGDPVYGGLRSVTNNMIRFGHRCTVVRLLLLGIFRPARPEGMAFSYEIWKANLAKVPNEELRARIQAIHSRVVFESIRYACEASMVMVFTLGVVLCFLTFILGAKWLADRVVAATAKWQALLAIEEEAEALSMPEVEVA